MKIAVAGIGYVGLSNAILLSQNNEVVAVDVSAQRVEMLNARQSPIDDPEVVEYLANHTFGHVGFGMKATTWWVSCA